MKRIEVGTLVICDFCGQENDSMGGVLIGSNAVCGVCVDKDGKDKPDYIYADEVDKIFDKKKTFKDNVLAYRKEMSGTERGWIEIWGEEELN